MLPEEDVRVHALKQVVADGKAFKLMLEEELPGFYQIRTLVELTDHFNVIVVEDENLEVLDLADLRREAGKFVPRKIQTLDCCKTPL